MFFMYVCGNGSGGLLVAGLLPRMTGFYPRPVRFRFVVNKLAMVYVSVWILWFFPLLVSFHQLSILTFRKTSGWRLGTFKQSIASLDGIELDRRVLLHCFISLHRFKLCWQWPYVLIFGYRICIRNIKAFSSLQLMFSRRFFRVLYRRKIIKKKKEAACRLLTVWGFVG
jgi:hypothetical protein